MAAGDISTHRIQHGSRSLEFTLIRRKRRTLSIHVRPDGRVEVLAPLRAPLHWVYDIVGRRAEWVEKHVERLAQLRQRHPVPRYVAGELHSYLGRQYRLEMEPAPEASVGIVGERLLVRGPHLARPGEVQRLLEGWFAGQCRRIFGERLDECLLRFPDPERVRPVRVTIRPMTSRWGSMSSSGRMSLNSRLIHTPVACIDYVIIHELCHRLQPNHSPAFWRLVAEIVPDYRSARARLKQEALFIDDSQGGSGDDWDRAE